MGTIGVVELEVVVQVPAEAGVLGGQVASEAGLPTLVEDGLLDPLDAAVGSGSTGPDIDVLGVELDEGY